MPPDDATVQDLADARKKMPPTALAPDDGTGDIDLRGDSKQLWTGTAKIFGLDCVFDADYQPIGPLRFQLKDVDYRVALRGNYGVDLSLKREINRFLLAEDPYGSTAFVRLGIARGEVRSDIDSTLIVSILDWTMERFQDALLTEELDPGLFPHPADPQKNQMRINQFLMVLKGAIGV